MASIDVLMKLRRQFISFIIYFWLPFQQTAWNNSALAGRIFMTLYLGEVVVAGWRGGVWKCMTQKSGLLKHDSINRATFVTS